MNSRSSKSNNGVKFPCFVKQDVYFDFLTIPSFNLIPKIGFILYAILGGLAFIVFLIWNLIELEWPKNMFRIVKKNDWNSSYDYY